MYVYDNRFDLYRELVMPDCSVTGILNDIKIFTLFRIFNEFRIHSRTNTVIYIRRGSH